MSSSNTTENNIESHVDTITQALQDKGQTSKKEWWERYLRGEIDFYGVPMADIRAVVKDWVMGSDQEKPLSLIKKTAFQLFEKHIAEQKLAAILLLQNHVPVVTVQDLRRLARLFQKGHIADWNTTDWLCVRVLGPAVQQGGEDVVKELKQWVNNTNNVLWQKRAALVAFVNVTESRVEDVLEIASVLVQDDRRFAQTAIGWTLRNLSKTHPTAVVTFVNKNKQTMSSEAMNMACAKLSDKHRQRVGLSNKRKRR